jgi:hypothetical protein
MTYGIKEIHSADEEECGGKTCQAKVYKPEGFCRVNNPWPQLVDTDFGHFCLEELHSPGSQEGQYGQSEKDDTHAAQPLSKTSPEQNAIGSRFYIIEYRRTRCCKTCHRFKIGIAKGVKRTGKQIGNGTEQSNTHPAECYDQESIPMSDFFSLLMTRKKKEYCSGNERDQAGYHKWYGICLIVNERHNHRQYHEKGYEDQDDADCIQNHFQIHQF